MAGEGTSRQPLGIGCQPDMAARDVGLGPAGAPSRGGLRGGGRRAWLVVSAACASLLLAASAALLWRRPALRDGGDGDGGSSPLLAAEGNHSKRGAPARGAGDSGGAPGPLPAAQGDLSERGVTFAKLAGASYCTAHDIKTWSCGFKCIEGVTKPRTCEGQVTKGYVAKWGDSCVVSFMGSQSYISMITDLEFYKKTVPWNGCKNCRVHEGYFDEWKRMRGCVMNSLAAAGCHRHRGKQSRGVHFTGHSLGGGLAAIAMMGLDERGYQVGESWTFGMPRTGDEHFANEFNRRFSDRFYRATHHMDPIPHLPPTDWIVNWHFQHVEPEVYFGGNVSEGYSMCKKDNDPDCSGKWWNVLYDAVHVFDHIRYMDFWIGTPGCGKNSSLSLSDEVSDLGGRNESQNATSSLLV